jgi:hypothetical protein
VARKKQIFNESLGWNAELSPTREAGAQMASASGDLFRRTVRTWLEMRNTTDGDTVFLTQPNPTETMDRRNRARGSRWSGVDRACGRTVGAPAVLGR